MLVCFFSMFPIRALVFTMVQTMFIFWFKYTGNLNSNGAIDYYQLIQRDSHAINQNTNLVVSEVIHNYLIHNVQADEVWGSLTSRRSYFPSAPIRYEFVTPWSHTTSIQPDPNIKVFNLRLQIHKITIH